MVRLDKAKQPLTNADARVANIALECGFADQSHLTRSFSAQLGMTPAAWRRQAQYGGEVRAAPKTVFHTKV
jgi:AraC family transcriptional regulator